MMLKGILMKSAATLIGLVTGLQSGFASYALPINTKYISDIRTVSGMSAEDAEAKFKAEGFTMMKTDVNPTLGQSVYIGYKTTTDADDAIRGLSFMNMRGKYSFSDYESTLAEHRAEVERNIEGLLPTIESFRKAYSAKTENALHAYEMLNHVFDYVSGEYMGDFLLSCPIESGAHEELTNAFLKGNSGIVMQIQRLFVLGGSTEKSCWLDRFEEASLEDLTAEYEASYYSASRAQKAMAQEYFLDAAVLLNQHWDTVYQIIQTVEEKYTVTEDGYDSTALLDELVESYDLPNGDTVSDAEAEKAAAEKLGTEEMQQQFRTDLTVMCINAEEYASLYETLSMYEYEGKPMLDFFRRPKEEVAVEELYPLVASLSAGERGASAAIGLTALITQAGTDDHWSGEREDAFKTWSEASGEVTLYYGVNLKAFEEGVALTSAAANRDRTNSRFARWWELFRDHSNAETAVQRFTQPFTFLALFGGCAAMFVVTAMLRKAVRTYINYAFKEAAAKGALEAGTRSTGAMAIQLIDGYKYEVEVNFFTDPVKWFRYNTGVAYHGGWMSSSLYIIFTGLLSALYILAIASLILAAVSAVMSIWHTANYTKIPAAICDAWQGGTFTDYILYDAVEGLDKANMEYGDMNGYVKKYGGFIADASEGWLVLYATKDKNAGDPITALQLTSGSSKIPLGYEGVTVFGEGNPVDLTAEAYTGQSDERQIILCCKRKELSGTDTVISAGVYAVTGGLALLCGGAIGALISIIRRKKAAQEAAEPAE